MCIFPLILLMLAWWHIFNGCCYEQHSSSFTNIANSQVTLEEQLEELMFLHKVMPGGASRSYGIEAARLAGVPKPVVQRARQVLDQLAA